MNFILILYIYIYYIALCDDLLWCWVGTNCFGVDFGFRTNKFESHSCNGLMPPSTYIYGEIIIMLYGYFGILVFCQKYCSVKDVAAPSESL
jgi:hypothetical protein